MSMEDTTNALVGIIPVAVSAGLAYKMADAFLPKAGIAQRGYSWQDEYHADLSAADDSSDVAKVQRKWRKKLVMMGVAPSEKVAGQMLKQAVVAPTPVAASRFW
jgi:hypothetical protein